MSPMRLFPKSAAAVLITCLAIAASLRPQSTSAAAAEEYLVMSYNLRFASTTPPNAWQDRRPAVRALLEKYTPDLIGTQEGVYAQLKDIAADLPAYDWIGLGRDGGSRGEFMAVFYRRDRFEPLEFDHFWLSDTPEVVGSSTWGNTNRRMVTWVRFLDRRTGRQFHFWNTHLDHALQPAREKGAELIRRRIEAIPAAHASLPLLLVGDFNAVAGANKAYDILLADGFLKDTWTIASERRNAEYNTFNGFETPRKEGKRIDWILARGSVDVRASEIVTYTHDGRIPSDHFPVVAWVRW